MSEPITIGIDEIREMRRLISLKEHAPETLQILDLALSQAEIIKAQGEEIAKLKQERDEAYEITALVCEDESVDAEYTGAKEDRAYNLAIKHCAAAIRALKSGSNHTEGK